MAREGELASVKSFLAECRPGAEAVQIGLHADSGLEVVCRQGVGIERREKARTAWTFGGAQVCDNRCLSLQWGKPGRPAKEDVC